MQTKSKYSYFGCLLIYLICCAPCLAQDNRLTNITLTHNADGTETLALGLQHPSAKIPSSFVTRHPTRISFDFPDFTSSILRNPSVGHSDLLKAVDVIQVAGKTRLVLTLTQPASTSVSIVENQINFDMVKPNAFQTQSVGSNAFKFDLDNISVFSAAQVISTLTGVQIRLAKSANGLITLKSAEELKADRLLDFFDNALRQYGYELKIKGSRASISSIDENFLKDGVCDTQTRIFHLINVKAVWLRPAIRNILTPCGRVDVDGKENALVVSDKRSNLVRINSLVGAADF